MKMYLSVLVLALVFSGCVQDEPVSPDTPPYEPSPSLPSQFQPEADYTYYSSPLFLIYHPQGWAVDDQQTASGVFIFSAPLEDDNDRIEEQFIVQIWAGEERTPAEFQAFEEGLMASGDVLSQAGPSTYKGRDAFIVEYESGDGMFFKTVFFRNGQWVYRLHYAVEKSKSAEYQPVMEDILDRFVIGSG